MLLLMLFLLVDGEVRGTATADKKNVAKDIAAGKALDALGLARAPGH